MPLSTDRRTGQEGRSSLQSVWRKPLMKTKDLQPGKGQKLSKPRPSCQSRAKLLNRRNTHNGRNGRNNWLFKSVDH